MKRNLIVIDSAALGAAIDEIEHNCLMLDLADEETALEDIGFYVPFIRRTAEDLRQMIKTAAPANRPEITIDRKGSEPANNG